MFISYATKEDAIAAILAHSDANDLCFDEDMAADLVYLGGVEEELMWGHDDLNEPTTEAVADPADLELEDPLAAVVAPIASGNMFGGMAAALGAVAETTSANTAAPTAQSRNTYTIEKDRPEQNGVKGRSAGGLCRAVWDYCDELRAAAGGTIPAVKEVRAAAEGKGWNPTNVTIEYYCWRKFHGITGRAAKPAPVVEKEVGAAAE